MRLKFKIDNYEIEDISIKVNNDGFYLKKEIYDDMLKNIGLRYISKRFIDAYLNIVSENCKYYRDNPNSFPKGPFYTNQFNAQLELDYLIKGLYKLDFVTVETNFDRHYVNIGNFNKLAALNSQNIHENVFDPKYLFRDIEFYFCFSYYFTLMPSIFYTSSPKKETVEFKVRCCFNSKNFDEFEYRLAILDENYFVEKKTLYNGVDYFIKY